MYHFKVVINHSYNMSLLIKKFDSLSGCMLIHCGRHAPPIHSKLASMW